MNHSSTVHTDLISAVNTDTRHSAKLRLKSSKNPVEFGVKVTRRHVTCSLNLCAADQKEKLLLAQFVSSECEKPATSQQVGGVMLGVEDKTVI